MASTQLALDGFAAPAGHNQGDPPSGLVFVPEAIDVDSERRLLATIDSQPWLTSMSRRVQHYGWRYDYKSRRVSPDSYLGPLPSFLSPLLAAFESYDFHPDQAIVNEYQPGQGIAAHVDCEPCFGPVVASLGLGSTAHMVFSHNATSRSWSLPFLQRGLLLLSGPARYEWTHAIAKRKSDPGAPAVRGRRVSVTFRAVISDGSA